MKAEGHMDTIAAPNRGRMTRRWLVALVGALAALLVLGLIVPVSSGLAPQSTIGGGFDTLLILAVQADPAGLLLVHLRRAAPSRDHHVAGLLSRPRDDDGRARREL